MWFTWVGYLGWFFDGVRFLLIYLVMDCCWVCGVNGIDLAVGVVCEIVDL
jgi:hypothetical protein